MEPTSLYMDDMDVEPQETSNLAQESQVKRKRNWWGTAIRLAISMGLIGLVLYIIDFRNLVRVITNLNPWYLVASAALIHLDRALMAYKWNLLLRKLKVRVPLSALFRVYMAAPLFQLVLPSTVGTDLFRLYILSRFKVDSRAVFASMILERLIGLAAILLLVVLSFGLAFYVFHDQWLELIGLGWILVIASIAITGLVIAGGLILVGIIHRLPQKWSQRLKLDKLRHIYVLSSEYRRYPGTLSRVFAWTFLEQLLPIAVLYLMAYALHLDTSFWQLAVIVPITTLMLRLPISLDGLGVQEGMYVLLFGMLGVLPSEAFLLSMLRRVVPMICALPWGIHHICDRNARALPKQPLSLGAR